MNSLLVKNTILQVHAPNYIGRYFRSTIKNEIHLQGITLHRGTQAKVRILPAPSHQGIIFRNAKTKEEIPANVENVKHTQNAVVLSNGNWQVSTVEHLLAALATLGITDLIVELEGEEIPILDGSSIEFFEIMSSVGVMEYKDSPITPIKLTNPVWVVSNDKYIIAVPSDEFKVTYTIHYEHPDLRGKSLSISLNSEVMKKEILPARTFGFLKDVELLKKKGLIRGASLENAVVLTEDGYLNQLRFSNECIRHKILDLVGDLYLLNRPLIAHIIAFKTGHTLDIALAKNIYHTLKSKEEYLYY
ncbi:MAG: UDP-3-O-acyl-N-acetylglucosamine deacetylase [Leptospiraceae bacterium]|nr:UDP-3-O-acyl-N-acetylglucosamine deacetylase [Leptospiraceae bacterium]MDW7975502.1 UDP-3-O-acyl-N-acetylglucosamine deacetylase [Leptospiraceae bacterium]